MCAAAAAPSAPNLWKIGRSTTSVALAEAEAAAAGLNVSKMGMMEEGKNCTLARFMISADNVHCSSASAAASYVLRSEPKFGFSGHKCARDSI